VGRVDGKVALISGAARGQGRAHAVALANEGADIIAFDICADIESNRYPLARPEDLAETARLVEKAGRKAATFECDVRDRNAVFDITGQAARDFGRIDIVVSNAGICPLGGDLGPDAFADAVDVDLVGAINTVHAALPHVPGGGSIIATGSLAALLPSSVDSPGNGPGGLGYGFAKQALANYVHNLAVVLAPQKIRVNAVHPTNCDTALLQNEQMYKVFRPDLPEPTRADAELTFPLMSAMNVPWVDPEDVSAAVLFLASDESRFVTGMQMRIDAGGYVRATPFRM
jgi:SDR family mycofactocin-dependent oxidoreductase